MYNGLNYIIHISNEETPMADYYYRTEIEYRGCTFEIEVYYDYSEGGSNSYGSDEPEWAEVEVTSIYNTRRVRPISDRLSNALLSEYGHLLAENIIHAHEA
jgi:hypothetical protein